MRHSRHAITIRTSPEDPRFPLTSPTLLSWLGPKTTPSGLTVSEKGSLAIPAVYRAVAIRAGTFAQTPIRVWRPEGATGRRKEEREPLLHDEPYPDMTPFEWKELLATHGLLWGNCYCLKIRNEAGDRLLRLLPLNPWDVSVERHEKYLRVDGAENPSGKVYRLNGDKTGTLWTPYEIMQVPWGIGYDGVRGLSPIAQARQALGAAQAAEEFGARFFANGSMLGGVLQSDEDIDQPKADELKRRWQVKMAGLAHAHEVAVLDKGAKYTPVGIPPQDAQFIESRKFGVLEVARLYGIPPHLLMDVEGSTSWGSGIESQAIQMLTFTSQPDFARFEQRVTRHVLLSRPGQNPDRRYAEFDVKRLLRADSATRGQFYHTGIQDGWFTRADAREDEGLEPIDGLEVPLFPANMKVLGEEATLPQRAQAAYQLIQAGYDPAAVAEAMGLPQMAHSGLPPTTVQKPEGPKAEPAPAAEPAEPSAAEQVRQLAELIPRLVPGVDKVVTPDEARELLNQAGASLEVPWEEEPEPAPAPPPPGQEEEPPPAEEDDQVDEDQPADPAGQPDEEAE